ncbi:hypothetical protein NEF87_000060 [Candidatus Lokiarchaeum ossiferum]|uniref:Uncharacterized protein n=1 Tax=Candidatus Lokiarchaeum ossiferum TaxID=2951803 RepID=A0ABY6HK62_9ARCH|nr:hypothetical protein NEF87_000060 [Candidatus Lokiarchaeum sp. B-35]
MRVIVKFKTILNLVWGTPINGREAFAFVRGFPATFFLTERRAIVVGEFTEKVGWFKPKKMHRIIFEAGLHKLKEFNISIIPEKRIFAGFISFHPHNQVGENATIQFLKMRPEIGKVIEDHLSNLEIRNPAEDSGIVMVDATAIPPQRWLNKRFGKKDGTPKILY